MDIYLEFGLKAKGRLTRRFSRSMGGHLANIEKYGGIIEYYESCREYIGKYYLRFERFGADMRFSAYPLLTL